MDALSIILLVLIVVGVIVARWLFKRLPNSPSRRNQPFPDEDYLP